MVSTTASLIAAVIALIVGIAIAFWWFKKKQKPILDKVPLLTEKDLQEYKINERRDTNESRNDTRAEGGGSRVADTRIREGKEREISSTASSLPAAGRISSGQDVPIPSSVDDRESNRNSKDKPKNNKRTVELHKPATL